MHRTEVVSTLQFFENIVSVILHWISMELFGWLGFVVFCSLWVRAFAANIMGRKFLICTGPARCLWRLATGTLFYMFESSFPLLLFLPYLW